MIGLLDVESKEFQQLLSKGHFVSYESCLFLAGPCNVGKTSLASILIDEEIPHVWDSTNGLEIWFGRNGIHIRDKKMIPLPRKKGQYKHDKYLPKTYSMLKLQELLFTIFYMYRV